MITIDRNAHLPLRHLSHLDLPGSGSLVRSRVPVLVAVMQVGIVRMLVQKPRVPVSVAMRLAGRRVLVLVMDVMHVAMFMLERFMQMLVVVRLREVQIDADPHQ